MLHLLGAEFDPIDVQRVAFLGLYAFLLRPLGNIRAFLLCITYYSNVIPKLTCTNVREIVFIEGVSIHNASKHGLYVLSAVFSTHLGALEI